MGEIPNEWADWNRPRNHKELRLIIRQFQELMHADALAQQKPGWEAGLTKEMKLLLDVVREEAARLLLASEAEADLNVCLRGLDEMREHFSAFLATALLDHEARFN